MELAAALPEESTDSGGGFLRDLLRKAAEIFGTRLLCLAFGLVTSVVISRALGPSGRGAYAVAVAVYTVGVQFGNLGLQVSNTYYVARDPGLLGALLGNSLAAALLIGGSIAGGAWVVFGLKPTLAPVDGPLLLLALVSVPFGLIYVLLQNLTIGIHRVRTTNAVEAIVTSSVLLATAGLAAFGAITAFTATAIPFTATCAGALLLLVALWNPAGGRLRIDLSVFRGTATYALRAYVAALFSFLLLKSDLLLVKHLLDAEAAGFYSVACSMADLLYMFPVAVGTVLFPKLTSLEDPVAQWRGARQAALIVALVVTAECLVGAVLAKPAVRLLYGTAFLPSVRPFLLLLPGIVCLSAQTMMVMFLSSVGLPWIVVLGSAFCFAVNAGLNLLFIPKWGIAGASVTSSFAYGLLLALIASAAYRRDRRYRRGAHAG